jgi:MYXO-CTERM domain-containing protein
MPRIPTRVGVVAVACTLAAPAAAQTWRDDTATTIGTTAQWTNKVELVDVDGDGWRDVVLANGSQYSTPGPPEASRIFRNRAMWGGAAPFFEEITTTVFGTATGHARVIKVHDIDGDGDEDIFVGQTYGDACKLHRRDDAGWTDVSATQLPAETPWVGDADFGDVDGDGDLDLALADWGVNLAGAPPVLYLNAGGTFTRAVGNIPATAVGWSWELDFADIDGDFDLDLLVASKTGLGSFVYTNDGGGVFTDATTGALPQHGNNYEMEVMDIDADGDVDLVTLNDGVGLRDHLFVNDGAGVFTDESATRIAGMAANPPEDDNMAAFVDIDSDGDPDFLVGSLSGPDRLLVNDGAGVFTADETAVPGSTPGTLGIAFGDVDGDRRTDLLMGQGEVTSPDKLYRALDSVPVDTAPPVIVVQHVDATATVVGARVHDGKTPLDRLELPEVALEYRGDATGSAPMAWYGEMLWRAELPAAGDYEYRVCATDATGNAACSAYVSTVPDMTPDAAVNPMTPDAAGPGDEGGGGCCETGTGASPSAAALLVLGVGLVLSRRRRR